MLLNRTVWSRGEPPRNIWDPSKNWVAWSPKESEECTKESLRVSRRGEETSLKRCRIWYSWVSSSVIMVNTHQRSAQGSTCSVIPVRSEPIE